VPWPRSLDEPTLCAAFQRTASERAGETALRRYPDAERITWAQYAERVRRIAAGLDRLGVRRGDTVALMLTNRPEFNLVDTAAMHLGAIGTSIYNTSAAEQIAHVLSDAGARVLVTERALVERARSGLAFGAPVEHVVVVDGDGDGDALSLAGLEEGAPRAGFDFDATWRAVRAADVVTLIYTSGTTGPSKGVEITHANVLAETRALQQVLGLEPGGHAISYLPSAHAADRITIYYGALLLLGTQLTCLADAKRLSEALVHCRPDLFGAVPRTWEKFKAAIEAWVRERPAAERAELEGALERAAAAIRARTAGAAEAAAPPPPDSDAACLARVRAHAGLDRVRVAFAGAAATPPDVLEFVLGLGVPLCDLWGMSELCSIATLVPPGTARVGTVGPPLPGVEVRLAPDGEVLVRSPTVMRGYRNLPERTAETFDEDGWLLTGDIGVLEPDGFLRIVDRKKELIISAAGKNMSPVNIESTLKAASALIGQACAIGDGRSYNVALLVLEPELAPAFAREHGAGGTTPAELAVDPAVLAAVRAGVDRANAQLSRVEQIKRFAVLPCDWAAAGDELTPTLKLRRRSIAAKYAAEIEALYAGPRQDQP
jgi:long-subunit acyl-CoA synthetase (AMP-forming)